MERLPGESGEVGRCRSEARGGLREYTKWRAAGHEGAQCHLDSLTKVDFVPENGGTNLLKNCNCERTTSKQFINIRAEVSFTVLFVP